MAYVPLYIDLTNPVIIHWSVVVTLIMPTITVQEEGKGNTAGRNYSNPI